MRGESRIAVAAPLRLEEKKKTPNHVWLKEGKMNRNPLRKKVEERKKEIVRDVLSSTAQKRENFLNTA